MNFAWVEEADDVDEGFEPWGGAVGVAVESGVRPHAGYG